MAEPNEHFVDETVSERRTSDRTHLWRQLTDARLEALEASMQETSRLTARIADNTDEIVAAFAAAKGFFTVMAGVGKVAKWLTIVGVAVAGMWALLKTGR